MKAYSQDLRERILQEVDEGKTQAEVARQLRVSEATVKRYVRQRREHGHVQPRPIPGRPAIKSVKVEKELISQVEQQPDATLEEYSAFMKERHGLSISPSTISRTLKRLKWTQKKSPSGERKK